MGFDDNLEDLIDSVENASSRGQATKSLKVGLKRKSTTTFADQHTVGQPPTESPASGSFVAPSQTKSTEKHRMEVVEVEVSKDAHAIDPKRARVAGEEPRLADALSRGTVNLSEIFNLMFQLSPPSASLVNGTTDFVGVQVAHHLSQVAHGSAELFVRSRLDAMEREEELRRLKERVRDLEA
ncbi:PREDICTED: uncharacterized protein LOC109149872 [Ipomoea nil]|uniref:uncharacterized protein LOC109149872 n=1 Tax=Ipomoea nil TaxID=35883 RepID=UPI000901EDE9|nr:PREDICTED: uncharacterized protein LOC109149872 [Ipomoea nil]XP_019153428.1 PREDICTED: uncharacterized protein LOC109149872 [Ipomoea nil]